MFFDTWAGVDRTLVAGFLAYAGLVILLRWLRKRTLSKMNAFDFIVTVALGSTLAMVMLSKTMPLAEGLLALMLFIGLQFVVTWSSVRIGLVRGLVTGSHSCSCSTADCCPWRCGAPMRLTLAWITSPRARYADGPLLAPLSREDVLR